MKELLESLKRTMARAVGIKEPAASPAARRILFVCMGNICRSPTAEGVFRKLLAERAPELDVEIDSAGTHGYHNGAPPGPARVSRGRAPRRRSQAAARAASDASRISSTSSSCSRWTSRIGSSYSRCVRPSIGTGSGCSWSSRRISNGARCPTRTTAVATGFEHVLDLVEEAAAGLLEHLRNTPPPPRGGAPSGARAG